MDKDTKIMRLEEENVKLRNDLAKERLRISNLIKKIDELLLRIDTQS